MQRILFYFFLLSTRCFFGVIVPDSTLAQDHENGELITSIDGEELYSKLCATCHGERGTPPEDIALFFQPPPTDLQLGPYRYGNSREAIAESIESGKGRNMLAFRSRLTRRQIDAVTEYVLSLGRK